MNIKILAVSLLSASCALIGCASQPPANASNERVTMAGLGRTPEAQGTTTTNHLGAGDALGDPQFDTFVEFAAVNGTWLDMYATQQFLNATPEQIAASTRKIVNGDVPQVVMADKQPGATTDEKPVAEVDPQIVQAE